MFEALHIYAVSEHVECECGIFSDTASFKYFDLVCLSEHSV